jgi:DNA replication protein DnaC
MDDLGAEKSSDWATGQLYLYLNSRLDSGFSTIITSNLSVDGLLREGYINKRIHSRLNTYETMEFFGPDRRRLKS